MREFCQSPHCDGLINFGSDDDGEIGACEKCGRKYELKIDYYLIPLDEPTDRPKYGTLVDHSLPHGEKIAELRLEKE